jgi:hypothetical protein
VNGNVSEAPILQSLFGALIAPMMDELKALRVEVAALRAEKAPVITEPDGWIDARDAQSYLGICKTKFDACRWKRTPRLKGSMFDGKEYFKKSDLDKYMRLYDLKSRGLA